MDRAARHTNPRGGHTLRVINGGVSFLRKDERLKTIYETAAQMIVRSEGAWRDYALLSMADE